MFGAKKLKIEEYGFGALRSASPAMAPRIEFQARGREIKVDLRANCSTPRPVRYFLQITCKAKNLLN